MGRVFDVVEGAPSVLDDEQVFRPPPSLLAGTRDCRNSVAKPRAHLMLLRKSSCNSRESDSQSAVGRTGSHEVEDSFSYLLDSSRRDAVQLNVVRAVRQRGRQ